MTKVLYRAIRSRRKFANAPEVKKELSSVLSKKTAPELKTKFSAVVANWKSDVSFRSKKVIRVDFIKVFLWPIGEDKLVWFYVDKGTKPHPIPVKNAPFLVFVGNGTYKPKTSPVGKFGGPGITIGGHIVKVNVVDHPGNAARKHTETIETDYTPTFRRDMELAFRRGIRKQGKSNVTY